MLSNVEASCWSCRLGWEIFSNGPLPGKSLWFLSVCVCVMTTCSSHSKIILLSCFSLFCLCQFLGVAFLAIGLWAWSEKVSRILMCNNKLQVYFCEAFYLQVSANIPQTRHIVVVYTRLCARNGHHGFTESERNAVLSCGTHEQWAMNWSDAFHRFVHCVLRVQKADNLLRALFHQSTFEDLDCYLILHTWLQLILFNYLLIANLL